MARLNITEEQLSELEVIVDEFFLIHNRMKNLLIAMGDLNTPEIKPETVKALKEDVFSVESVAKMLYGDMLQGGK